MKRIEALDIAKGFAIICVVIGHVVSRDNVPGADWYTVLKSGLYSFHMPLFMGLSGMALGLSWRHRSSWGQVGDLVVRRLRTLMIPYMVFGVLVVAGKLAFRPYMHVDYPPESFLSGIVNLVLYPVYSPSMFLWYLQVLAMYFVIVPWMLQADQLRAPWILLAVAIVLNQFTWTPLLNMPGFVTFLPFFSAGILIGQHWHRTVSTVLSPRYLLAWLLPFSVALVYALSVQPLPKWFVGALSIPAVLCLAQTIRGAVARQLVFFGNHTLSIYLMNTIFIGIVKAIMISFIPWRDHYFIIHFVVLSFAGLLLPIATKLIIARTRPSVAAYI